ncbi:oligodendrocyte-myelin glycoprotein [Ornithorhynchus anatinus]|nr:oligodendrocyte-myelin glycoprotein [Ornithorhynchus anatinus]
MSPCLLILLFLIPSVLCVCPPQCLCSGSHRHVDCSGRNLSTLPPGLQNNIVHLNLSYNNFTDLDDKLTRYSNLRTLDISHNRLVHLPAELPRSLWEIFATDNIIKLLHKLDTAYQWNLKVLDVSKNMVERVVLIKNTLSSLKFLNLSSNKLWTVPTNMPSNVEMVDLSNNSLTQILPGTLKELLHLTHLYLHNNKFTSIPDQALDQLSQLQVITLQNNRWSCNDKENITYLVKWVTETNAQVIGAPCPNQTTPWQENTTYATSSAPSGTLTVQGIQAVNTVSPLNLITHATQVTKVPRRFQAESTLSATLSQSVLFTSTDEPLALYPEDLPTEQTRSHEAAAATRTIRLQDAIAANTTKSPTTPMVLSITSGVPTNFSEMPQSTTVTLRREETTTSILNTRLRSTASVWKVYAPYILMLNVAVILIT